MPAGFFMSGLQNNMTTTRVLSHGIALFYSRMVPALERVYAIAGYLAAASLFCIFLTTMLQMTTRIIGINLRGLTDYAGYFMAASAFLAFAHTFNHGSHIRIELFLSMMGRMRVWGERFSFLCATLATIWLTYFVWSMVYWSWQLNDVSQGMDATPIWLPQLSMAVGATVFAIAVLDHTCRLFLFGQHEVPAAPDAL
jgi:TRAP-type C4-dicarboxylate transport system permease small subunit